MNTRLGGVVWLLVVTAFVLSTARLSALHWRQSCEVGSLSSGEYLLTITNTDGPLSGEQAVGALTLRCTHSTDVSPKSGKGPEEGEDQARVPLYGYSDIDLTHVLEHVANHDEVPPASSTDPIYPGILVFRFDQPIVFEDPAGGSTMLVIGTLSNRRDGRQFLDGPGIGLHVESSNNTIVKGSWGPWGLVRTGSGTFRLERS